MQSSDQRLIDITVSAFIRIIREIAVVGVIAYLCVKLFSGDLSLDFGKLSPTELVSFLLAFFSIGLSAAFYFAATSQSNQFYDNVNKFSKDTSELLGRLDEQVKGIGGRQSELKDSIDKYYLHNRERQTEEASERVAEQAKEVEQDLSSLVAQLLEKSTLSSDEKSEFEEKLKEKDAELNALRQSMRRTARVREKAVRQYTQRRIEQLGVEKASMFSIDDLLLEICKDSVSAFRRDMLSLGFILTETPQSSADISDEGRQLVLAALEQAVEARNRS